MTGDELHEAKAVHRTRAREARCALPAELCRRHAEQASENLLTLPELGSARVVLAYAATAEELDPAPALEALHGWGCAVALPRVEAPGVLGIHLVAHGEPLETGPFGIAQPSEAAERVPFDLVDVVVVPGVAFDMSGQRIGYGGGYYDRLLPRLREDCLLVGFAYDEQVADALPTAEHDVRMDTIVTPSRVIRTDSAEAR